MTGLGRATEGKANSKKTLVGFQTNSDPKGKTLCFVELPVLLNVDEFVLTRFAGSRTVPPSRWFASDSLQYLLTNALDLFCSSMFLFLKDFQGGKHHSCKLSLLTLPTANIHLDTNHGSPLEAIR